MPTGIILWYTPPPPPPPKATSVAYPVYLIGGDTAQPATLLRTIFHATTWSRQGATGIYITRVEYNSPHFFPMTGALLAAIQAAGAGHKLVGISAPFAITTEIGILFDTGISPRIWFAPQSWSSTPIWTPATGLAAGDGSIMAGGAPIPGRDALAVITGANTQKTSDGIAYSAGGAPPSTLVDVLWEIGHTDVYLGIATGGVVKTIDRGVTWGYVRPHAANPATTIPAGWVGRGIAYMAAPPPPTASAAVLVATSTIYRRLGDGDVWATVDGAIGSTQARFMVYKGDGETYHITAGLSAGVVRYSADSGDNWATRALPAPAESLRGPVERASDARIWVTGIKTTGTDQAYAFWSDDQGANFTLADTVNAAVNTGHMGVHKANPNYLAYSLIGTSGQTRLRVSTNRGSSWTTRDADTASTFNPAIASGFVLWSGNRLIIVYNLTNNTQNIRWSDDFGANWTSGFLQGGLVNPHTQAVVQGGVQGPIFVARTKGSNTAVGLILRSVDRGQTWEELDSPVSDNHPIVGFDYDVATDRLFVLFDDNNYRIVSNASTRAAADWLAGFTTVVGPGGTQSVEGSSLALLIG